jgi:hypothetical protein
MKPTNGVMGRVGERLEIKALPGLPFRNSGPGIADAQLDI